MATHPAAILGLLLALLGAVSGPSCPAPGSPDPVPLTASLRGSSGDPAPPQPTIRSLAIESRHPGEPRECPYEEDAPDESFDREEPEDPDPTDHWLLLARMTPAQSPAVVRMLGQPGIWIAASRTALRSTVLRC